MVVVHMSGLLISLGFKRVESKFFICVSSVWVSEIVIFLCLVGKSIVQNSVFPRSYLRRKPVEGIVRLHAVKTQDITVSHRDQCRLSLFELEEAFCCDL